MNIGIRRILSIVLIVTLIVGTGIYSYGKEGNLDQDESTGAEALEEPVDPEEPEEPVDPEDPEEPVDPDEPEEPVDPEDPDEPVDPEDPDEPVDPEEPEEPADPEEPEEPMDPEEPEEPTEPEGPEEPTDPEQAEGNPSIEITVITKEYSYKVGDTIHYNIIISNTGDVDLEDVTYIDELTGGRNIGNLSPEEELTIEGDYQIPLDYEEDILTNTVYVSGRFGEEIVEDQDGFEVEIEEMAMPMATGTLADEYYATTDVFPLYMESNNDHTQAKLVWLYQNGLYIAIFSKRPIIEIWYQNAIMSQPLKLINPDVDRAENLDDPLKINNDNYYIKDYFPDSKSHNHYRWNVVNLGNVAITPQFNIHVKTGAPGHDIEGEDGNIEIYKSLLVYHKYDNGELVLDTIQSGSLAGDRNYSVYPRYEYGDNTYTLTKIETIYNGVLQPDKDSSHLDENGNLTGIVDLRDLNANGMITFIYEKVEDGYLTITKILENDFESKYNHKEFDIFIEDPDNKVYVVSLKPGQSATITGLKYGTYNIKEVVPANFELVSITDDGAVTIDGSNDVVIQVINQFTNDGWFQDEDKKENTFKMETNFSEIAYSNEIDVASGGFPLDNSRNLVDDIALLNAEYFKKIQTFAEFEL